MFPSRRSQRLRACDYERVLDAVAVLQGAEAPSMRIWNGPPVTTLAKRMFGALAVLVSESSFASIAVMPDMTTRSFDVLTSARIHSELHSVGSGLGEKLGKAVCRHEGYRQLQDLLLAGHVLADVQTMSRHEIVNSAPYRECYLPRDAGFHAAFTMPGPVNPYIIAVFRSRDPIAEREVAMIRTLRDHLRRLPADVARIESPPSTLEGADMMRLCELGLRPSEAEVMRWVCEGKRDTEIAIILDKSVRTVNAQMRSIFSTFGVETRMAAAKIAVDYLRDRPV